MLARRVRVRRHDARRARIEGWYLVLPLAETGAVQPRGPQAVADGAYAR